MEGKMANGELTVSKVREEIARSGAGWQAEENPISRLPMEEKRRRLGLAPPPGELSLMEVMQRSAPAHAGAAPGAPTAFDLRNVKGNNYITPIRDQGNCGSCVSFGSVATIEGSIAWQQKKPNPTTNLSEAQLYYCYGAKENVTCATGWWPNKALAYCISGGLVDDQCFPYTAGDQPCKLCPDWQKRLTKIKSTTVLTGNAAAMKQWISSKGPIVGCFIVYDDFFNYKSGVYKHVTGNEAGGHCISIVGYDDSTSCWICKNSWGTGWGEKGFFRIAYGECGMETWQVIGVDA
jgi:C1A family cysteine protease